MRQARAQMLTMLSWSTTPGWQAVQLPSHAFPSAMISQAMYRTRAACAMCHAGIKWQTMRSFTSPAATSTLYGECNKWMVHSNNSR